MEKTTHLKKIVRTFNVEYPSYETQPLIVKKTKAVKYLFKLAGCLKTQQASDWNIH